MDQRCQPMPRSRCWPAPAVGKTQFVGSPGQEEQQPMDGLASCLISTLLHMGMLPLFLPEQGNCLGDLLLLLPVTPFLAALGELLERETSRFANRAWRHELHGRSWQGHERMAMNADLWTDARQPLHQRLAQSFVLRRFTW